MSYSNREKELFDQALDLTNSAEREAFLARECAGDHALLDRLRGLLAAHESTTAFLSQAPRTLVVLPADQPGEQPGDRIDRYKLLERVGEGGCGVVYVADQTEPVRRRVALKVIKLGMDTKAVVARFEAERQALAMMDHPNIAKVLDAGATERGRPYFVMELVRGIPITHYCDQNNLSTTARLGLFIQVCQAVQHAHQKGIIHRDIKPSNILVTVNDGAAVPKVIDFGIAKATEGRLTDATIYTQLHQFIGTPAYMSPEQAEMTSLDIDTRSDIYSLGVLLYELLSGKTPFEAKDLMAAGLDVMRRTIREQEPARPSTKLATMQGEELSTTAKRRATEPPKLLRQLQGDLDWIVMKCLEKDRTRRYETANGLAADLQRHLSNEPVVARPPSAAYRLQKAWQRHRPAFAVAALIAVVLVAATAFSIWQARTARRAQAEATARALAERTAREEAEALVQFLGDVFRSPDPGRDGRTITVAETLAGAARRLETDLASQPERRARLQAALAETYKGLSFLHEAEALMRKVVEHHRTTVGPDHTNTLQAMVLWAETLHLSGNEAEAMRSREGLFEQHTRLLGPEHLLTLKSMVALADSYRHFDDKRDQGIRLLTVVLEAYRRQLGPDHLLTREVRIALGWHEYWKSRKRTAEVESLLREMLAEFRREKGAEHVDTIRLLGDLTIYTLSGDGLQLAQETVELSRKVYGPEHSATINWMGNLADHYLAAGRRDDGLKMREEVLALNRKVLGPEHPSIIHNMHSLAHAYRDAGRPAEALKLHEELPALCRKVLGAEHPTTLGIMGCLAAAYFDTGRQDEALKLCEEVLALNRRILGPEHPYTVSALNALAWLLATSETAELRDGARAVQLAEQAVTATFRKESAYLSTLAAAYAEAQQFDKAVATQREAIALYPTVGDRKSAVLRLELYQAGKPYRAAGSPDVGPGWMDVVEAHLRAGGLVEAEHALVAGMEALELDTITAQSLATLQLWFGETEAYERLRGRLLDWAMGDTNFISGERMAKLASLRTHATPAESEKALTLARRAVEQGAGHGYHAWFLLSLGLVEHRAGLHAAAAETLVAAEQASLSRPADERARIRATARLYRALGLQQQGRTDEAVGLFLEGEAAMKSPPAGTSNPFRDGENQNDVIAWLAHREAAALVQLPDDEALRAQRAEARPRFLSEILANDPNAYGFTVKLASALFQAGRPEEAMQTYEVASSGDHPNPETALDLAVLQLWRKDLAGYERTRTRLLNWVPDLTDPRRGGWIARLAGLRDYAVPAEAERSLALARRTVEVGKDHAHLPWFLLCRGMAEYRAGLIPAAERTLLEADQAASKFGPHNRLRVQGIARFYRAMCQFRQGQAEAARTLFHDTEAATKPWPADGKIPPLNEIICNDFILALVCEEARSLLDQPAAPTKSP